MTRTRWRRPTLFFAIPCKNLARSGWAVDDSTARAPVFGGAVTKVVMKRRFKSRFRWQAVAVGWLCLAVSGCVGLRAGSRYPDYSSSDVREQLLSSENEKEPGIDFDEVKVSPKTCEGVNTATVTAALAHDDLARFLRQQNVAEQITIKARGNLFWYDFPGTDPEAGDTVRLRVAVLADAKEAANELHKSLLEHGPGWWGLRRANLSILAPKAGLSEALAFVLKYKLACWGMFQMADADDVYVVPGPYMEL
jgi:hypothetical protein